ncbi:MAG: domain 2 [Pseudomonadota bacterium]
MLRQPAEPAPSPAGRVPPVAPPRSTLPGDRWYVLTPRGQVGPYKADEFASRLETGEVSWDMLIWRHGLRDWKAGRRDDLLVIAVAGTLGLGNKTTPLEGLSALMRSSSTAAESARAPDGAGEWRVDDDDTRLESWPLGMRLRPTLPPQSPSVQQGLPAQRSPQMLSSQRSLPPQPSLLQQRALPPQARPPSAQFSLSAQHVLPAQPPVSLQQALSTSVPGSPTQRVRVPGTRPPPPLTSRNTASQGNARETPTGRFPRSSANSPEIKRGGRATSIAILAFAAGAVVALSSGRIVDLSRVVLGEPPVEAASQQRESPAAGQLPAVFSRWFAEEPRAAKPPAPDPVEGSTSTDPSSVGKSADQPGSQTPALASSGNVEIVTRSLPAPEEVRDELKRLSATLSRCVRNPAAGLDVEFTVDGPTGGVGKLDVHAPELTPGRLECLKEGFSDLHVRPFVSSELKYRHRFAW